MNKRFLLILILTALAASTAYQYYDSWATPLQAPVDSRPSDQTLLVSSWNIQDGRTLFGADNIMNVKKEFENGLGNRDIVALQDATLEEFLAGRSQEYGAHVHGTANTIMSKHSTRVS